MSDGSSKKATTKPKVKWGWISALVVSVVSFVLAQFVVALVLYLLGWNIDSLTLTQTYFIGSLSVLLPIAGIYLYLQKVDSFLGGLGLKTRPKKFIKPLLKTFGFYLLSTSAALLVVTALAPGINLDEAQDLGLGSDPTHWYQFIMLGLLLVVFTPTSEEIIFRGFMLRGLAGKFGWGVAAVATALLFGLAHGQLNVAIDTAIMGWWSAQLVIQTKSLWPSIAMHALKNSIAFGLVYLAPLL